MQKKRTFTKLAVLTATAGLLWPAAALTQQAPLAMGTLTCSLTSSDSAGPAGEKAQGREAVCLFRPGASGAEETYVALLQFVSRDNDAIAGTKTLMLAVKAPASAPLTPGLLEQTYAADASAGTAGRQAPLVGQRNSSLVLHPEGEQAQASLALGQPGTITLIVAELKLKSSPA